ncbi:AbrB family transcriptional regulator [Chelativorans xinjiangense]|uniref:AbrB family transcriptional regulator n=1 Tax=Chelativorans xinjiangense TaxID=2681485 RepID=UPI00135679E8|nr:AbrB family transcriptional regulator [Chelativorans xinjiangense]
MMARSLLALAGGLCASAFAGWFFFLLGVPLAWILGAMAGSAIYANTVGLGGKTKYIRRAGQLLIGASTAAILTPDILSQLLGLLPAMVAAAVVANALGVVLAFPLQRIARVDRKTAFLSTLPAGMSEMASLARETGAQADVVVVVHTLRVAMIVVCVPLLFGIDRGAAGASVSADASYAALLMCVFGGLVLSAVTAKLGVLNPWVIMPMAVGIAIVSLGLPIRQMPPALIVLAQILIGFSLGARLKKEDFERVPRAVLAAILCSGGLILIMIFGFGPILRHFVEAAPTTLALALAPGGLGEMIASAKALGAASAVVAGFQFTRSFLTNIIAPPLLVRFAASSKGSRT